MLPRPGLPGFDYVKATSTQQALQLLQDYGGEARLLLGGTDLLVRIRQAEIRPRLLIDLKALPGLRDVRYDPERGLTVGTAVTMNDLAHHPLVRAHYPLLAEAASSVASYTLRNRATLGGNLANASPCADTAPATLVLGGRMVLQGPRGQREVPAGQFFRGPGQTVLQPGEFLSAVRYPVPPAGSAGRYLKLGRNKAGDLALVSVAIWATPDEQVPAGYRFQVALGAVAPVPLAAPAVGDLLTGQSPSEQAFDRAAEQAMQAASPIDDVRASAAYRRAMVRNLTRRGLQQTWERLQEPASCTPPPPAQPSPARPFSGRQKARPPAASHTITLTLNGTPERRTIPAHTTLLQLLREELAQTGTKNGCNAGECGACTVLLNGEPVNACMVLAVEADGAKVVTVEGLGQADQLNTLQQAFVDEGAVQCGFCTPGMLISAQALLQRNPQPNEQEIREALLGHLCRCTGYTRILRAVQKAARSQTQGDDDER